MKQGYMELGPDEFEHHDWQDGDVVLQFYGPAGDYTLVRSMEIGMKLKGYYVVDRDDNSDSDDLLCWTMFRKYNFVK